MGVVCIVFFTQKLLAPDKCMTQQADILLTARLAEPEVADRDLAESVLSSTYWGREDDLDI